MANEETKAAGAQAAQPADGGKTPVAEQQGDDRIAARARAIEAERERDALKAKLAKYEEDKLKEAGKWQELAAKHEAESKSTKAQLRRERIERHIVAAAAKAGANDPNDFVPFVTIPDDLDDANADGLAEFISQNVDKAAKAKPYLLKSTDNLKPNAANTKGAPAGGGGNPPSDLSNVNKSNVWKQSIDTLKQLDPLSRR